jgi:hypothetical protein
LTITSCGIQEKEAADRRSAVLTSTEQSACLSKPRSGEGSVWWDASMRLRRSEGSGWPVRRVSAVSIGAGSAKGVDT